jgi:hypothetical protein
MDCPTEPLAVPIVNANASIDASVSGESWLYENDHLAPPKSLSERKPWEDE